MVRYEDDLVVWAEQTAEALRERRTEEIDWQHVAEEILDVGSEQEHALESRLMQIMLHLLKKRYQPERDGKSWDLSIKEQRLRVDKLFRRNPSLKARAAEFLPDAYSLARVRAARQTDIELPVFPEECFFSLDDVIPQKNP